MCDGVSALMALSTAVSAIGGMRQADAAADAAEFNAQVDRQNAILADRRAKDAIERGKLEEEKKKRETTLEKQQQEASFTASNLDLGFGSPLDVIVSTATAGELEAATIRANAEREAEDFQVQGVNARNSARLRDTEARNSRSAGRIGAIGTVLSGGSGILKHRANLTAVG